MTRRAPRFIRVEGDVAYVPLTRGYEAVIDAADAHLVDGFKWYALVQPNSKVVYACRIAGPRGGRKTIRMHRAIIGEIGDLHCDHIDGDGLNNRRANLRQATRLENMRNTRLRSNNTSGIKGVSWRKDVNKWYAQISSGGKKRSLGLFQSADAAAAAYAKASAEIHGAFGRLA